MPLLAPDGAAVFVMVVASRFMISLP